MTVQERYDFYWSETLARIEAETEGRIVRLARLDNGNEVPYYEARIEGKPSACAKNSPDTVFLGSGVISQIIKTRQGCSDPR